MVSDIINNGQMTCLVQIICLKLNRKTGQVEVKRLYCSQERRKGINKKVHIQCIFIKKMKKSDSFCQILYNKYFCLYIVLSL